MRVGPFSLYSGQRPSVACSRTLWWDTVTHRHLDAWAQTHFLRSPHVGKQIHRAGQVRYVDRRKHRLFFNTSQLWYCTPHIFLHTPHLGDHSHRLACKTNNSLIIHILRTPHVSYCVETCYFQTPHMFSTSDCSCTVHIFWMALISNRGTIHYHPIPHLAENHHSLKYHHM